MMLYTTVKIEEPGGERVFEPVKEVSRESGKLVVHTEQKSHRLDPEARILSVKPYHPSVSEGDWVRYVDSDTDSIHEGKVTSVRDEEIILKQLPDGFQVAVSKEQILESDSDR